MKKSKPNNLEEMILKMAKDELNLQEVVAHLKTQTDLTEEEIVKTIWHLIAEGKLRYATDQTLKVEW